MHSLRAILALIRWPNGLLAAAGVLVGAWWAGGEIIDSTVGLVVVAALALTAVANAENDYQDRELDLVAHPDRPLPSGSLAPRTARIIVVAGALVAVACASLAGAALGAVTVGVVGVMLAYTPLLARHGLLGNIVVGIVASLPFAYGAWAAGAPRASLPLLGVAVPLHIAREVAKDIEDVAGDRGTRRTVPVIRGPRAAVGLLITALTAGLVALIPLVVDRPRLAAFILPAVVAATLGTRRVVRGVPGAPTLYKVAMACAMVSLVLSHWRR